MATTFTHDYEPHFLQLAGEVVGCCREISHDACVPTSAQSDELVVLCDDMGCWFGEVHCEVHLLGT